MLLKELLVMEEKRFTASPDRVAEDYCKMPAS
jgi:hypothetical protein